MNLIINKKDYKIDDNIKVFGVIATDLAYVYKDKKLRFGYIEYKGEFIQLIGVLECNSMLAAVIEYNNFKFAFLFDDIDTSKSASTNDLLSDLIKRLINE